MDENVLAHYGVLGMKWGVRRYQNKDGSLTDAGRKRYDRDVRENLAKKKENRIDTSKPDPERWAKEDLTRIKKSVDNMSSLVKETQKINEKYTPKKGRLDLSQMSDKELQKKIDRENLERKYNDLFNVERASKGKQFVENALEAAGTVLVVGSSALSIALAIKELKR